MKINNSIAKYGLAPKILKSEINGTEHLTEMEELVGFTTSDKFKTDKPEVKDKIKNSIDKIKEAFRNEQIRHNDLNPTNIMVNDLGDVKVIDFALGQKGIPSSDFDFDYLDFFSKNL